jgi:phospholipase D/transphosphatidylase
VAVDGQILIVTSANLSASAEERNIELGLRLEDPVLTGAVESRMRELEPFLYERVHR